VKLLCVICTVKTNRFYIPGETKLVERLRKDSFDKGIFACITYLYKTYSYEEQTTGVCKLNDLKKYIKDKVLNLIELGDLTYHAQVIDQLIDLIKKDPNMFKPLPPLTHLPPIDELNGGSSVNDYGTGGG
jgi:hypothetical protein